MTKEDQLIEAAKSNDVDKVRQLLREGDVVVESFDIPVPVVSRTGVDYEYGGLNALGWAVLKGNSEIVGILLEKMPKKKDGTRNVEVCMDNTPILTIAERGGDAETIRVVKLYLEKMAQ